MGRHRAELLRAGRRHPAHAAARGAAAGSTSWPRSTACAWPTSSTPATATCTRSSATTARRAARPSAPRSCAGRIVEACVDAGGSITGEHGVGVDKKRYMPTMFAEPDLAAFQKLRCAFDPARPGQPGQGDADAAAVRRGARARTASTRSRRPAWPSASEVARHVARETRASPRRRRAATRRRGRRAHRGGGTKLGWGDARRRAPTSSCRPPALDRSSSTTPATSPPCSRPACRSREPQERFAERGPDARARPAGRERRATIGGVVATGDSGPLRHRYGGRARPRARHDRRAADGTVARAGGKVIKNVAGYDLAKLFDRRRSGRSGVIVEVAVRLHPLPRATATRDGEADDPGALARVAAALAARALEPSALDVRWRGGAGRVLARFGGVAAAAPGARRATLLAEAGGSTDLVDDDERAVGATSAPASAREPGVVVRVSRAQAAARASCCGAAERPGATRRRPRGARRLLAARSARRRRRRPTAVRELRARAGARRPASCSTRRTRCAARRPLGRRRRARARRSCAASRSASTRAASATRASSSGGSERLATAARLGRDPPAEHELIDDCVHCGFCLPTCPTYALWDEEMDSPRGRIVLMRAGLEEGSELSAALVSHFDRCLGCMACVTACPSGVQYDKLIEDTRAQVERNCDRAAARAAAAPRDLRALPPPRPAARAGAAARRRRAARPRPAAARSGCASGARACARWPARAQPALRDAAPPARAHAGRAASDARAASRFLQGCVQRVFFGDVNEATVAVLAAEGFEVHAPRAPRCCGALQLHSGEDDERRARSRKETIAAFEDYDVVVVNAAGCGSAMKDYGHLLRDDPEWAERAEAFAAKVRDVTELLAERRAAAPARPSGRADRSPTTTPATWPTPRACARSRASCCARSPGSSSSSPPDGRSAAARPASTT